MPTLFAIDTAAQRCSLALLRDSAIDSLAGERGNSHLEHVLPMIDRLFVAGSLQPQDCDAFAFGSGPGSFTGLRVACTIVQGLALGAGKPVVPVGNLLALAYASGRAAASGGFAAGVPLRVLAALDARMDETYWAVYEGSGTAWNERSAPALCANGELAGKVREFAPDLCGGDAAWLRIRLAECAVPVVDAAVDAAAIAVLAEQMWRAGESVAPERALPAYVRNRVARTVAERMGASAAGASA